MDAFEIHQERDIFQLERALLRRGMDERTARRKGCFRCSRTPLIGERVYLIEAEKLLCELCRPSDDSSGDWTFVHGPEFGHTLKLLERHAA
jgi:hypothetical protein